MRETPTAVSSAVAALGLTGGFLLGRWTGRRELGGALFAVTAVTAAAVTAADLVTRSAAR